MRCEYVKSLQLQSQTVGRAILFISLTATNAVQRLIKGGLSAPDTPFQFLEWATLVRPLSTAKTISR